MTLSLHASSRSDKPTRRDKRSTNGCEKNEREREREREREQFCILRIATPHSYVQNICRLPNPPVNRAQSKEMRDKGMTLALYHVKEKPHVDQSHSDFFIPRDREILDASLIEWGVAARLTKMF